MAQALTFERWPWDRAAAEGLAVAVGDDGDIIADEVRSGISKCWRINGGEAWMVTREEGDELVLECMQGRNARQIVAVLFDRARAAGFASIRAHTKRPGLERMFRRYGVRRREIVLEVEL